VRSGTSRLVHKIFLVQSVRTFWPELFEFSCETKISSLWLFECIDISLVEIDHLWPSSDFNSYLVIYLQVGCVSLKRSRLEFSHGCRGYIAFDSYLCKSLAIPFAFFSNKNDSSLRVVNFAFQVAC